MSTTKMVFSSLLIAIVIIIETVVVYTGESLVAITILSTIPIYIICRIDILIGWLAFLAVGILLLILSPHQMMFFICTNGLIGASLGISKVKTNSFIIQSTASSVLLFFGLTIIIGVLGIESAIYKHWYYIVALVTFCFAYCSLFNFMLSKIYVFIKRVTKLEIL